ncbi:hypothetical protein HK098_004288 [Nowakowskiella sp. JEL0407]|nr:hypothetical protein HK098_004288 [Nowakowskiella sp. JEL0407]
MEHSKISSLMKLSTSQKLKTTLLLMIILAFLYISTESLRIESSDSPSQDFIVKKPAPDSEITILFFASKNSDWMCSSIRSALIMGYKVEFFGWGDNEGVRPDWSNATLKHIGKFQGVWEYLQSIPEKSSKLYLIADAWDSIFQLPAAKFLENYRKSSRQNSSNTVIVSSEGKCWPFMHWKDQDHVEKLYCKPQRDIALSFTKDTSHYFQYINTGATIGTASALLPWFKLVLDVWRNEKESITKVGKKAEYLDDQGAAMVAFNRLHKSSNKESGNQSPNVLLDYYNELFFNIQNSEPYIYVKNTLIDQKRIMGPEALWFVAPKASIPAIIHANGPAKADFPLYESAWLRTVDSKLLQSGWDRKIGTRKFGQVPLRDLCDPKAVEKQYREWENKKLSTA